MNILEKYIPPVIVFLPFQSAVESTKNLNKSLSCKAKTARRQIEVKK